ncbi:hypothetical protein Aple_027740 [Acrocarpospora pleiomorpha]|uniref:Uncharacterized protein n=1 Tax=Acrocarpospora pleiomorpha TaxID=90975 RepID=A0A5M3XNT3_9ACTN|nr:hypothetical protein [Acrocarpospora pleiomorpha]GES19878.1 hypothetical protein Aple_027740 [Acrocarpospora pleiomorpha]
MNRTKTVWRLLGGAIALVSLVALVAAVIRAVNIAAEVNIADVAAVLLAATGTTLGVLAWVRGPARSAAGSGTPRGDGPDILRYDSEREADPFAEWGYHIAFGRNKDDIWRTSISTAGRTATIRSLTHDSVGLNKLLPFISGAIEFEYQVVESDPTDRYLYFALIPMQQSRSGLRELGGAVWADPQNPRSPFRIREFVPPSHYGDDQWHTLRMPFDFAKFGDVSSTIFAPRMNEGIDQRANGTVIIRKVRVWQS